MSQKFFLICYLYKEVSGDGGAHIFTEIPQYTESKITLYTILFYVMVILITLLYSGGVLPLCEDVREAILQKIYEEYGKLLKKVAYQHLYDYQEAEDAVQTVLYQLLSKHTELLKEDKLKHYLCVAVKNTAINLHRTKEKTVVQDPFVLYEMTEDRVDVQAFQDKYGFGEELG